jgi:hypothetical protein
LGGLADSTIKKILNLVIGDPMNGDLPYVDLAPNSPKTKDPSRALSCHGTATQRLRLKNEETIPPMWLKAVVASMIVKAEGPAVGGSVD